MGFIPGLGFVDQCVGEAFIPAPCGQGFAQRLETIVVAIRLALGVEPEIDGGRDIIHAQQPGDFFDQVNFPFQIGAESRGLPEGVIGIRFNLLESQLPESGTKINFSNEILPEFAHTLSGKYLLKTIFGRASIFTVKPAFNSHLLESVTLNKIVVFSFKLLKVNFEDDVVLVEVSAYFQI